MSRSRGNAPRRVLLITTHYHPVVGGVESHARDVARGLRSRGRQVVVLTTRVDAHDRTAVARVDRVPVIRTAPAVGRQRFTKWLFIPVAFIAAIRLRRHVDVIFCPDLRGVAVAALAAGAWLGIPVVIQGATPGAYSASHWDHAARQLPLPIPAWALSLARRWLHRLHRLAAAAVCITREHEREAVASGIPAERVHYIPHGVDTTRFQPVPSADREVLRRGLAWDGRLVVLFLGRISREKGVMELLEAWSRHPRPEAMLVFVGPDMPGHSLDAGPAARSFVAEHGLASDVFFAGAMPDPVPVLQASDVLVQPSHYEAFPVTVIEAMACGLPVVASWVGGLRDYLIDGENALVCPPGDVVALAARLDAILADARLRARLARAGQAVVADRFDRNRNLDAYVDVFDRAVPPRTRRRSS